MNNHEDKREFLKRPTIPVSSGESCKISLKICCHKMEGALAEGKLIILSQKTVFNEKNEILHAQKPILRSRDGLPINQCPFCRAEVILEKDVSEMVTCWKTGGVHWPKDK